MKTIQLFLLVFAATGYVFGEGEEDPFDPSAFAASVDSSTKSTESDSLSALFGANISLTETATAYVDDETSSFLGKTSGKVFAKVTKPSLGTIFASMTFDHTLNLASDDSSFANSYGKIDDKFSEPRLALSEFHYSLDIDKVLFIRFGQQVIGWGASYFWSAADFINQSKSDSQAAFDTRVGKMGLRLHLPLDTSNLFFFWDLSGGLSENKVYDFAKSASYAAKFDTKVLGFELGLVSKLAPNETLDLGTTLSGNILSFDIWAEYGAQLPLFDKDFEQSYAIGFEKSFADATEVKLRSEFFYQSRGNDDVKILSPASLTPYYWGKYYVYGYLGFEKIERSNFDIGFSTIWNLSDTSSTHKLAFGAKLFEQVPIQLSVSYSTGPKDREFTKLTGGDSWKVGVQTNIEF